MNRVAINEAEAIFEPFWDGGESYPCPQKYGVLQEYQKRIHPDAVAKAEQTWCSAAVQIEKGAGSEVPSCVLSRDCMLNIEGYDRLMANVSASRETRVTVRCTVDGTERLILDFHGVDQNHEVEGELHGRCMTHIEIAVYAEWEGCAELFWLGLANAKKREEMLKKPSGFQSDWSGCFAEGEPDFSPRIGLFFSAEELETLRERVKRPPYDTKYAALREQLAQYRSLNPEQLIGDYLGHPDPRWERDRDRWPFSSGNLMTDLALVGAIDQDEELLRLACRLALSVSCSRYWSEGFMGALPGTTWHHRSFSEDILLTGCAAVLDFAGNFLSWHGRNLIHNAMILRGLSRMDADFFTMEYIHGMNQGIVFSRGRINALIALAYDYPRFHTRILEAKQVLEAALGRYLMEDGGCPEGPGYWNYAVSESFATYAVLAKYHQKSLEETLPEVLKKAGNYALSILSACGAGDTILPVSDTQNNFHVSPCIAAVYAKVGENREVWRRIYQNYIAEGLSDQASLMYFLLCPLDEAKENHPRPGFWNSTVSGHVGNVQETEDVGIVNFHAMCGPKVFSHSHGDNGSFLLEAAGEPLLIDPGVVDYSSPLGHRLRLARCHNVLLPVNPDGIAYEQDPNGRAKTSFSAFEDGIWRYTAELSSGWEKGLFTKNFRRIFSPDPHLYLVMDEVAYQTPHASAFLAHTYGQISLTQGGLLVQGSRAQVFLLPLGWTPAEADWEEYGKVKDRQLRHARLQTEVAPGCRMITVVAVTPYGGQAPVIHGDSLSFRGMELTARAGENGAEIVWNGRRFTAEGEQWN